MSKCVYSVPRTNVPGIFACFCNLSNENHRKIIEGPIAAFQDILVKERKGIIGEDD